MYFGQQLTTPTLIIFHPANKPNSKLMMSGSKRDMELEINDLEKKAKFYSDKLENAKIELEKKKTVDFDNFIEVMKSDSCTLCSESLMDCVDHIGRGIGSYECECSRQRIVHVKCWTRDFRCSCGVMAISPVSTCGSVSDVKSSINTVKQMATCASSVEDIIEEMYYPEYLDSIRNLQTLIRETPGIPSRLMGCVNSICNESSSIGENIDRIFREAKVIYGQTNRCCNKLNTILNSGSSSRLDGLDDSDSDYSA